MCNCTSGNDEDKLLPVIGQNLRAGFAETGTILLQARQHDLVAVIDLRAAEPRDIARAGVVSLLGRSRRSHQDKWNEQKKSGHLIVPSNASMNGMNAF
jgi:hypothetical protein